MQMLLALILASIFSSIPPPVSKFLSCKVAVNIVAMGSTFRLYGEMAMNAEQDKLFLTLYGDNPQHYWYKTNITVVVIPSTGLSLHGSVADSDLCLNVWTLQDGKCDMQLVNPSQIPPLSLPTNSVYRGNKTVSGKECETWRVANPYAQVEYVDVSVTDGNVYLLESQAWTALAVGDKFGVATTIALTEHNNTEPGNNIFHTPEGCAKMEYD